MCYAISGSSAPQAPAALAAPVEGERREELFRGVVRTLARDAARTLSEVRFCDDPSQPAARQQLEAVNHYLSYLLRLCDGRV